MNIFGGIYDKIFGKKQAAPAPTPAPAAGQAQPVPQAPRPVPQAPAAPAQPVDVEAVLSQMAATAPGHGGNWRTSIVDLLHLLGLDSSLAARKSLAQELGVHAGADGTAEQNIALYKAVMRELEKNGGKVPASMKD